MLVPLWRRAGVDVIAWTRADLDVTRPADVTSAVRDAGVGVVVHLAAWTNVDAAETEAAAAFAVNRDGSAHVAAACRDAGALCVYVSSDYVLQGDSEEPLAPAAPVRARGVYAESKAAGEAAVQQAGGDWLIARTGWVFGPGGRNFVDTMRGLAARHQPVSVTSDQHGAPTSTSLISAVLYRLVSSGRHGIWHLAPRGATTWFDVAREVYAVLGEDPALVTPCTTAESKRPAPRPGWSVLDVEATERAIGTALPPWERDVRSYLVTGKLPDSMEEAISR